MSDSARILLATALVLNAVAFAGGASAQEFAPTDPEKKIQWAPDLPTAMARAAAEKKPVFISFSVNFMGNPHDTTC